MIPKFEVGQDVTITSFTGAHLKCGDKVKIKEVMFDDWLKKYMYLVTKGDSILWCLERELK